MTLFLIIFSIFPLFSFSLPLFPSKCYMPLSMFLLLILSSFSFSLPFSLSTSHFLLSYCTSLFNLNLFSPSRFLPPHLSPPFLFQYPSHVTLPSSHISLSLSLSLFPSLRSQSSSFSVPHLYLYAFSPLITMCACLSITTISLFISPSIFLSLSCFTLSLFLCPYVRPFSLPHLSAFQLASSLSTYGQDLSGTCSTKPRPSHGQHVCQFVSVPWSLSRVKNRPHLCLDQELNYLKTLL